MTKIEREKTINDGLDGFLEDCDKTARCTDPAFLQLFGVKYDDDVAIKASKTQTEINNKTSFYQLTSPEVIKQTLTHLFVDSRIAKLLLDTLTPLN